SHLSRAEFDVLVALAAQPDSLGPARLYLARCANRAGNFCEAELGPNSRSELHSVFGAQRKTRKFPGTGNEKAAKRISITFRLGPNEKISRIRIRRGYDSEGIVPSFPGIFLVNSGAKFEGFRVWVSITESNEAVGAGTTNVTKSQVEAQKLGARGARP
ncbi:hypothetical protein ABZ599_38905, partial [Streptomyces misionensis]|uniref:hypothetical protein n=1 Tax=Streptomyces misionensis TaxID=67331 RepID=UPI003405B3EA